MRTTEGGQKKLTKDLVGKPNEELLEELNEETIEDLKAKLLDKSKEELENISLKEIEGPPQEKLLEKLKDELTVKQIEEKIDGNIEQLSEEISEKPTKEEEDKEKLLKDQTAKRKKVIRGIIASVCTLFVFYLGMASYFTNHFYFGSEINSISVSGKTVEEAKAIVASNLQDYTLTLKERQGGNEQLKVGNADLKYNSDKEFNELKSKQSPLRWIIESFDKKDSIMTVELSYNESLLREEIDKLSCFKSGNISEPKNASLQFQGNSYVIIDHDPGNKVDKENLYSKIVESVNSGEKEIDLDSEGCYTNPQYDSMSEKVIKVKDMLNKYVSSKITYDFGEKQETVDGVIINKWIKIDDDYKVTFDEEKISNYINTLSENYDTVGKTRKFTTTLGNTIDVTGGDYGWFIDKEKEIENLINDIKEGKTVTRKPSFNEAAFSYADNASYVSNDIGSTYVEINITRQHLWFYKNGSLVVEGDVVTGNMDGSHATPPGVYRLKYKENNAILRGPGYATRVSFWMPFNQDIGIHDAVWRGSFGGNIYYGNGSHGCVNSPYSLANTIFDNIDPGTPIVCYY